MEPEDMVSTRLIHEWQAAELTITPEWYLARLRRQGRAPTHVKVRGRIMYELGAILRWCDGRISEWRLSLITGRPWKSKE